MNFNQGLAPLPDMAITEWLALHWHCTPAEADEQTENARDLALTWVRAEGEAARIRALGQE